MTNDTKSVHKTPASQPKVFKIAPGSSELAPFVYFDGTIAYSLNKGTLQLELAANTIVPDGTGGTRIDAVITAHLRCNAAAAVNLRDAIDKALQMEALQTAEQPMPSAAELN